MKRFDPSRLRERLNSAQVPGWARSAWSDLSDGGSLRWVALGLVVAIIAIPLFLAKGSSEPAPAPSATAAADPVSHEVLENAKSTDRPLGTPGKGVNGQMSNPFAPPASSGSTAGATASGAAPTAATGIPSSAGASSAGASAGGSTAGSPSTPSAGSPTSTSTSTSRSRSSSSGSTTGSGSRTTSRPRWYFLEAAIRLEAGDKVTKLDARPAGLLPSREAPVFVYVGASPDRRYATFMPAPGTVVDRGARCRPDPQQCWFIRVRRGRTVSLRVLAGTAGETPVKLKVTSIERKRVGTSSPRGGASMARSG